MIIVPFCNANFVVYNICGILAMAMLALLIILPITLSSRKDINKHIDDCMVLSMFHSIIRLIWFIICNEYRVGEEIDFSNIIGSILSIVVIGIMSVPFEIQLRRKEK